MGQRVGLHADPRHGQGQSRPGTRRRCHNGSRTRSSQPLAPDAEHEGSEHKPQTRPCSTFGKLGQAVDRASRQASAENYLLNLSKGSAFARGSRLDSHPRTAQSDRMMATPSRTAPAAGSADHRLLPSLLCKPYPAVMGILNITPDSFSDGGRFIAPERALAQARRMIAEGADIIDIGAESTRPYGSAEPVSAEEELKRLQPVLPEVISLGIPISIDSMKSAVVAWALEAGASIANDVWGLQRDPDMARLLALRHAPVIIMHNRDQVDAG